MKKKHKKLINFQNCQKSKSDNTFTLKKPFVTPNFCKQNLSQMHRFKTVDIFTFKLLWFEMICSTSNRLVPEQF